MKSVGASFVAASALFLISPSASAADPPMGTPPPDAKALVEAPKAPGEAPKIAKSPDGTNISLSAGGVLATGNSRMLALTLNGAAESRFNDNGIGASVLGNYGQSATPGKSITATAENVQGR